MAGSYYRANAGTTQKGSQTKACKVHIFLWHKKFVSKKTFFFLVGIGYNFLFSRSAWIEDTYIKPFFEFKEQLIKSSKTVAFKEAVMRIEEFISDPVVCIFCCLCV